MSNLGTAAEHRVKADLIKHGWTFLARPGASKGPADLVFLSRSILLLVQVKRTDPQLSPAERIELVTMADVIGLEIGLPVVATTPFRKPVDYRLLTGTGPKDWMPWEPVTSWSYDPIRAHLDAMTTWPRLDPA
jgi:hypothetical protein